MSSSRNLTTPISICVAVLCAGWAIYATQHKAAPGAGAPTAGGPRANAPAFVTLAPVRAERISQKLEAATPARMNPST
jgi:hypothetical protein